MGCEAAAHSTGARLGGEGDLKSIVRSVLWVARLGEVDLRGWWGTRSFGAAGRVVLKQRLPRTWRMAAVELDVAAASSRHSEVMDRTNAVHLFSDNWPVRRWANAWVSEEKTTVPPSGFFAQLETAGIDDVASALDLRGSIPRDVSGKAVRIGSVSRADFGSPVLLAPKVSELAAVYGQVGSEFAVPYLEVEG